MCRIDTCRHDGDAKLAFKLRVEGRAENDMGVGVDFLADFVGCFVHLKEGHVIAASDADQHTACALHGHIVEKRVVDGGAGRIERAAFAFGFAHAHHCSAHALHDRADIGKIEIDEARHDHQVGDAANAGIENVIGHAESIRKGRALIGNAEKVLVWHDDHRVDRLAHFSETIFGDGHPAIAFKAEWLGDNTDGEDAALVGCARDNGRCACACAAAETGSNEDHVSAFKAFVDFFDRFFGRCSADFRLGASAKSCSRFRAELDTRFAFRPLECLRIRICDDELNPLKVRLDHIVDCVTAGPANTEHDEPRLEFLSHE